MKIELNRYRDGKKRALTFSYDDGAVEDYRLVELFNKYGVVGTFHLNSGNLSAFSNASGPRVKKEDVKTLYKGHEVSSHTVSHPDLRGIGLNELREEILKDRENLENLSGHIVRGMSYPYGTYNDTVLEILPYLGIEYSRTTRSHKSMNLPEDFLQWHPTCHHRDALECMEAFENARWFKMPLFYIWGHSYEFTRNNNWELGEEILKRVSGKSDVWYASNIDIADYIKAVRALKFSVDNKIVYNPSATCVWIEADGESVKIESGYNYL